jgi:hypothetical protein
MDEILCETVVMMGSEEKKSEKESGTRNFL